MWDVALTNNSAVRCENVAQSGHLQGELLVCHQNNRLPQGRVGGASAHGEGRARTVNNTETTNKNCKKMSDKPPR